jgi:hypothetical protein
MPLIVNKQILPRDHPNRSTRKLIEPKARIWHGTSNFDAKATDIMNAKYAGRKYIKKFDKINKKWIYFEEDGVTPFRYGSTHVYIDADSVCQIALFDEETYNCGDRQLPYQNTNPNVNGYKGQMKLAHDLFDNRQNLYTWSIELCMNKMSQWDTVCSNALEFIKIYIPNKNIPDYRHYDITGKNCPSPFVNMSIKGIDPRWLEFRKAIDKTLGKKV